MARHRHPDDDRLRSSKREIEKFTESHTWKDIVDWVNERKEHLEMGLRDAKTIEDLRKIQGGLDQLDDVLMLPTWFIEQKEAEQKLESNNEV